MRFPVSPMDRPTAAGYIATQKPCAKCEGTGLFFDIKGAIRGTCFACNGMRVMGATPPAKRELPSVDVESAALFDAFGRATASGLKRPRITIGGMTITKAGATSANAGALYVKAGDDGAYLGKIVGSKFLRSRECTEEQESAVAALLANPMEEAIAQGKRTGRCCMCGLDLTDPESIERGIGPICADRWFGA